VDLDSAAAAALAGYTVIDSGGPDAITWSVNGQRQSLDAGTSLHRVRFKRGFVTIDRPWLDPQLLDFDGWHMPGIKAGYYSTGTLAGNTGVFGLLVTGFIVAANVEIDATWAAADRHILAAAATGTSTVQLGPFALGGTPGAPDASGTVRVPGLQVYAYVSLRVPLLPKVDPP
jgi:hypothetical protein